jgi:hypothetical protein
MMVHHTSPVVSRLDSRPTYGNSRSGDQPGIYINWSSSRKVYRSNSRLTFEDSRLMDQPTKQSNMIWTHAQSVRASLLSQLDNADLTESTLMTNDYMLTISS